MTEGPFAYVVTESDGWGDEVVAVASTLALAAVMSREKLPRFNGALVGKAQRVAAYFRGGVGSDPVTVPLEAFARRDDSETDASVLAWIRQRRDKVMAARALKPEAEHVWQEADGAGRCSWSDPEAKQLADYRATGDWLWRDDVNEDWWRVCELAGAADGG